MIKKGGRIYRILRLFCNFTYSLGGGGNAWKYIKKVLAVLVCVFTIPVMLFLGGCHERSALEEKKEIEFPVNERGYPQNNIVIINDTSYPIDIVGHSHIDSKVDSEIEIKMEKKSNIVEIVLPQYLPINNWSIEEKEYVNLISYNKTDFPIKMGYDWRNINSGYKNLKFKSSTDETTEILLKWANINEVDKLFKDKKEDYLLKISVSYY